MSTSSQLHKSSKRRLPLGDLSNVVPSPPLSLPAAAAKNPPKATQKALIQHVFSANDLHSHSRKDSCQDKDDVTDRTSLDDPPYQNFSTPARTVPSIADASTPFPPSSTSSLCPGSTTQSNLVLYSRRRNPDSSNLTMSCPPLGSRSLTEGYPQDARASSERSYEHSQGISQEKRKRARRSLPSSTIQRLPESFVNFQRSYFAEVDAFALSEEEVGSQDEQDD